VALTLPVSAALAEPLSPSEAPVVEATSLTEDQLRQASRIKAETVQVILIPRRIQTYECDDQTEPTGVGSVSVSRERFEALLTMPYDALMPVLQMLIAEKLRFIDLHGERMRYRSATIKSYRLEMNMDLDDMPADT
jgi:hypothetical protein